LQKLSGDWSTSGKIHDRFFIIIIIIVVVVVVVATMTVTADY
jgi:flagellar basal body-associated protein FliL